MKNKHVYYFAYGSNMSYERLFDRIGTCEKIGIFTLNNWELKFNHGAKRSVANIIQNNGAKTKGVLYKITTKQFRRLNLFEGVGLKQGYSIHEISFMLKNQKCNAFFYYNKNIREELLEPIELEYYHYLQQGYLENNMIDELNALNKKLEEKYAENIKFSEPVEESNRVHPNKASRHTGKYNYTRR